MTSEIGSKAAAKRLGINLDTLYVWVSKDKKRTEKLQAIVQDKGPEILVADCEAFKKAPEEAAKQDRMEFITIFNHKWPTKRLCEILKVSGDISA